MATVEVVSATSAFQDEKIEETIDQVETNTYVKETDHQGAPSTVADEEPAATAAEAETLAAEVETKVVVKETKDEEPATASAGVQSEGAAKVVPEPAVEETIKETNGPADTEVVTGEEKEDEEEEEEVEKADADHEAEDKVGDEAAAAAQVDKSV